MNILGFVGSPRSEGTTNFVVKTILDSAESHGAKTKLYNLNEMNFKGCQGCRKCKETGKCDLNDDMSPLYDEILAADVIIIASPVYMAYVTGQTKLFLDRLYAFKGPDQVSRVPKGKRSVLVLTQGYEDINAYQNLVKSVSSLIDRLGFEVIEKFVVGGVYAPEDSAAQQAKIKAQQLGKFLANLS